MSHFTTPQRVDGCDRSLGLTHLLLGELARCLGLFLQVIVILRGELALLGRHVRVHSLQARPDLNNIVGRCMVWDDKNGRAGIRVAVQTKLLSIKPANLTVITDQEFIDALAAPDVEVEEAPPADASEPTLSEQ